MPLQLKIITPMRTAVDASVSSVLVPSAQGEMEILPGHADLIAALGNGELSYRIPGEETSALFIGGGFLQVSNDQLLIVTDTVLEASEIDTATVEQAIERAQAAFRNTSSVLDREEQAKLEAHIAKQMAMLDFRRKRRI